MSSLLSADTGCGGKIADSPLHTTMVIARNKCITVNYVFKNKKAGVGRCKACGILSIVV